MIAFVLVGLAFLLGMVPAVLAYTGDTLPLWYGSLLTIVGMVAFFGGVVTSVFFGPMPTLAGVAVVVLGTLIGYAVFGA